MINTDKIKGKMRELRITQADIAKALKLAQPTVNQKINNLRPFDLEEAEKVANILNISNAEFADYFFA